MNISRMRNALAWAVNRSQGPVRLRPGRCPSCGPTLFIGRGVSPISFRCISCLATITALGVVELIRRLPIGQSGCAWEMATYGATLDYLRRWGGKVIDSEFFSGVPSGTYHNGVRCEDVCATSFVSDPLDLVTSSQVFEHVDDDVKGYGECFRILKPGGFLIFSVPLFDRPASSRIAKITDGKIVPVSGELELHGSRITGPKSVPTFWHFSRHDIASRVASVGFEATLHDIILARGVVAQPVIVGRKPF